MHDVATFINAIEDTQMGYVKGVVSRTCGILIRSKIAGNSRR
jgi:hypothetical protein